MEELIEKSDKISFEYDEEADVLYISFGKPEKALSLDLGSGIIARQSESGKLVGFTLIGLKSILLSK
ncbi:MAG: DUF2283 domain-containing protein [Nanoarchaeota archaeon]|nr:DUF2283 domain-containing protein [Nanoarchaeota archaeon]